jgi:hypothetical protein
MLPLYDEGYLPPEAIADRVRIKGRGGTVLQPAIDLLDHAPDFPKDGPILIITDAQCDQPPSQARPRLPDPGGCETTIRPDRKVFRVEIDCSTSDFGSARTEICSFAESEMPSFTRRSS